MRLVRYGTQRPPVPCRFCGRRVVWALTDHKKAMPLDPDPVPDGVWVLWWYAEEEPEPRQRVTYVRSLGPEYLGERWASHWATCAEREVARHLQEQNRAEGGVQLSLFVGGKL